MEVGAILEKCSKMDKLLVKIYLQKDYNQSERGFILQKLPQILVKIIKDVTA